MSKEYTFAKEHSFFISTSGLCLNLFDATNDNLSFFYLCLTKLLNTKITHTENTLLYSSLIRLKPQISCLCNPKSGRLLKVNLKDLAKYVFPAIQGMFLGEILFLVLDARSFLLELDDHEDYFVAITDIRVKICSYFQARDSPNYQGKFTPQYPGGTMPGQRYFHCF